MHFPYVIKSNALHGNLTMTKTKTKKKRTKLTPIFELQNIHNISLAD
jgi:hypothetical protein